MIRTYGSMPDTLPEGAFKAVTFPVMAMVDTKTDYRVIDGAGLGVRELGLTIYGQFAQSFGHDGAVVTGSLREVTINPDTGIVSGRGFLLDTPDGRMHALMIKTQAMNGNSVDLADVQAQWEMDLQTGAETLRFTSANIAATTGVGKPAFANATIELADEITAAFGSEDPMEPLVDTSGPLGCNVLAAVDGDIVASGSLVAPFDDFHMPEASKLTKVVVDADGRVYGHLSAWGSCHDGIEGRCVVTPRPIDGYASFNKPGVLTERGIVGTGPIFAYGGHRRPKNGEDIEDAYGSIENAWCDVRITEGRLGPWLSGRVRPGVPDDVVYAARASRISGHWVGGKLKAIVSVNAEGFEVPGDDLLAASFGFRLDADGHVAEMVASFPACATAAETQPTTTSTGAAVVFNEQELAALRTLLANVNHAHGAGTSTVNVGDDDARLLALLLDDVDGDDDHTLI